MLGAAFGASLSQSVVTRMIEAPAARACWKAICRSGESATWKLAVSVKPSWSPCTRAPAAPGKASVRAATAAEASRAARVFRWAIGGKFSSNTGIGGSERLADPCHHRLEGRERLLGAAIAPQQPGVKAPEVPVERRVRRPVAPAVIDEPAQAEARAALDERRDC